MLRRTRGGWGLWCEHAHDIAAGIWRTASASLALLSGADTSSPEVAQTGTDKGGETIAPPVDLYTTQLTPEQAATFVPGAGSPAEGGRVKHYRAVPSTRVGRAAGFTSLFVQLGWSKLVYSVQRRGGTEGASKELISSEGHQKIVFTLSRMRGAVLKLGQMLSIQDESTVPRRVTAIFESVRDSAMAMPERQLVAVLQDALGGRGPAGNESWESNFVTFNKEPIAAASIGQVHAATILAPLAAPGGSDQAPHRFYTDEHGKQRPVWDVAVKVQYPGVADSIGSDVANLKLLMSLNILPPGMFVDSILKELKAELTQECNYEIEAAKQERYRALVLSDPALSQFFNVPRVIRELSGRQVLTTEFVSGVNIDKLIGDTANDPGDLLAALPQSFKNHIARNMMRLTLSELFKWRFMQTDPNFSNFLFDARQNKVHLLDFGAAREYDEAFVSEYLDVVAAAANCDRDAIVEKGITLGFLTGKEMKPMLDAHTESVIILGKPFRRRRRYPAAAADNTGPSQTDDRDAYDYPPFDFSAENLPSQIQQHVPTMIKLRLRPPPTPIYSLHRRLSGTILLCTKLGATIDSSRMFWDIYYEAMAKRHQRP